jgi:hypothetical protein
MTPAQFVDQLNTNAGNVLSVSERATAISLFGSATNTSNLTARAQALRQVAEDADLNSAEFNRGFVLMQYFGYLRRNPNDAPDADYTGYDFWLTKLNQFNGTLLTPTWSKPSSGRANTGSASDRRAWPAPPIKNGVRPGILRFSDPQSLDRCC